jgi:iron(III) transport system ATP-binding protein
MSTLELRNVAKSFGETKVLQNLNLLIHEGEFFTLLGPSGCGKTTTLRMVAGFSFPDSGNILVDGEDMTQLVPEKRGIGMVFQNYALFPHLSVSENVAFGLRMHRVSKTEAADRVEKYIRLVRLEGYGKRRIAELSGGQQQRVALARALAIEPRILLLDEPLSNLDAKLREEMRLELRSIQKKLGMTTIYVTHDQSEALSMSDRVAVFEKGRCTQVDVPGHIYSAPVNPFIASFVGATNLIPCQVRTRGPLGMKVFSLGAEIDARATGEALPETQYMLSIRPECIVPCALEEATFIGEFLDAVFNGATITITSRVEGTLLTACILNDGMVTLPTRGGTLGLRVKVGGATLVALSEGNPHA